MKIKMKLKDKSHRYDINRPTSRNEHKYIKYKISQYKNACIYQATPKLSNTEAELKNSIAYKKSVCLLKR